VMSSTARKLAVARSPAALHSRSLLCTGAELLELDDVAAKDVIGVALF